MDGLDAKRATEDQAATQSKNEREKQGKTDADRSEIFKGPGLLLAFAGMVLLVEFKGMAEGKKQSLQGKVLT